MTTLNTSEQERPNIPAFGWGALIGILGGLIGLGGAEFRLPVLTGVFKYRTLKAITINLVVSLVTVIFSFIFRTGLINLNKIAANAGIILNILSGSLIGAYIGVHFATKVNERALSRIVIVFLIVLSIILVSYNFIVGLQSLQFPVMVRILLGFVMGIIIGVFSSMLGVAGGELIIPTILIIFSTDIKLAGSLSLAISIPTILIGLFRYKRQGKLDDIRFESRFILWMALGSILGALTGSYLLRFAPSVFLHTLLGIILLVSAIKLLRDHSHKSRGDSRVAPT
ncbi:MAG: sulfite exporter TauE/SafE family protein [Anaerolineales bacterium]|nr:sulfite exporter TauE/SafE family protein [Anaerolineales bacterium]